ncbi:MAG: pyruvate formate-lyase-activating protein [Bacillota bacterium]
MEQNNKTKGYIHSIESFGTVDGPGVRFVVFLQGCSLRCKYCHNPDTWDVNVGNQMSVSEILDKYESCKAYLKNGGLTVTGGEPLLQHDFVCALFKGAKARGIHTCLDTSGITFTRAKTEKFNTLMQYTDLVMLDIKHIESEAHKELTAHPNENILDFALYLGEIGKAVWVRHVVVPFITLKEDALEKLGYFIGGISSLKALDVLPYHKMGEVKYENLNMASPLKDTPAATKQEAEKAKQIIMRGLMRRLKDDK